MRTKDPVLMQAIIDFINTYYEKNGESPTLRTIADAVGSNRNSVQRYLIELNERNEIIYKPRNIRTPKMERIDRGVQNVGLVGSISCGIPTLEEEHIECYLHLPTRIFGTGELYLLKANGDSMIGAGIDSDDLVVIQKTNEAKNGDIVVALVDDETTLKRFYYDEAKHKVRLHAENRKYEDILAESCIVQGVATHVIKTLKNDMITKLG